MPRPRKPTALRVLQGNAGHRALPKNEPQPPLGAQPPAWLTPAALEEWNRLAPELEASRVLTVLDADCLAHYCDQHASIAARSKTGQDVDPRERAELRQWAMQLGMTPASRPKVQAVEPPKGGKLQRFIGGPRG